jgi:hypothetical protein
MLWGIVVLAVLMVAFGRWGRRRAADLVSPVLSADDQAKQLRVYRRAALTLQVVGVFLLGFAIVGIVH